MNRDAITSGISGIRGGHIRGPSGCPVACGRGAPSEPVRASTERITEHFLGDPLVDPGLDFLARWFPDEPGKDVPAAEDLEPYQRILMAAIAKK
jgi:hypothetical protein